jgi:deazaflavin-dependent oxidoreductase (nitroreductase family)
MSIVQRLSQVLACLFFLLEQTSFAATVKESGTAVSKDLGEILQTYGSPEDQGGVVAERRLLQVAQARSELNDFNQKIITEFRANQGKVGGQYANRPLLLLTTTGAKSGKTYTHPLAYTKDGDRLVVIASFGGAPKNPSWYHNLVAHPEVTVEVGSERFQARATVATGEERQRLYDRQAEQIPAFAEYQKKTKRQIPVIVLTRID